MKTIEAECRSIYRAHTPPMVRAAPGGEAAASDEATAAPGASKFGSAPEPQYICYAAKANSLLIRSDGRIGKCTVALDDDRNTIGRICEDGTIELDNLKLRPWLRGLDDLSVSALACPLSGLPA